MQYWKSTGIVYAHTVTFNKTLCMLIFSTKISTIKNIMGIMSTFCESKLFLLYLIHYPEQVIEIFIWILH